MVQPDTAELFPLTRRQARVLLQLGDSARENEPPKGDVVAAMKYRHIQEACKALAAGLKRNGESGGA